MAERECVTYIYDGSFEGFLTAVFEVYSRRQEPEAITIEEGVQLAFDKHVCTIRTDGGKAERVHKGIGLKMGQIAYQNVITTFLSGDDSKEMVLLRYIQHGMKIGPRIVDDLAHDTVVAMDKLRRHIEGEAHLLKGFVRFSLLEGGIFYARITPKNNVIPLLMPHFVDRFSIQPFILYDKEHFLAGIYDTQSWYMAEAEAINPPPVAKEDIQFQRMWRSFYNSIGIKERKNFKCRRTHMPMRYWKNMTEFTFYENQYTRDGTLALDNGK